ncbi:MAG: hypothetical protein DMG65_03730 [Candidatus Angelobacter sp. Gp1-AA117]|nr:MAG: hypothetical protein DMG65_03730 [Candidatus Angelobacter sp. Gp1-AA117]
MFLIVICVLAAIALVWNAKHAVKLPINITSSLNVAFIQTIESKSLPEVPRWKATAIRTTDSFGNDIEVIVGVLWDPYRWVKGNAELVAIDEAEKHRYSIEDVIRSFQNNEHRPIIAIGLASHENVRENPDQENERAGDRADRLVELCGRHFISKPHIYSLNFGAYSPNGNPSRFSASERRVVLVVINQGENSPELMQRLKPALLQAWQQGSLMFNPKDYLLFDTPEFQLKKRQNF